MSGTRDKRLRFAVDQDMQLLKEIVRSNPFEDVDRWRDVHERFVNECNVPFSLRTCKDHANHLLNLHLKDSLKMRPKESPEKFAKKKKYLDQILELRKTYCVDAAPRRGRKSSVTNNEGGGAYATLIKQEPSFMKREEDSDDDFYWDEENERDKKEKERDANDADGKLRKLEVALEQRSAILKEKRAQLEEERRELDELEKRRRSELEEAERAAYHQVTVQNQTIVTALMDRYQRRTNGNNLCIL